MSTRFLCLLTLSLFISYTSVFGQQCQSAIINIGEAIPDGDPSGVSIEMPLNLSGTLGVDYALDSIHLNIGHTYVGDLFAKLINPAGDTIILFDRPGVPEPATGFGCGNDDVDATFSTTSNLLAENLCYTFPALAGNLKPINPFIQSGNIAGTWKLFVADMAGADIGSVNGFTFYFTPLWYKDQDGDGFGGSITVKSCAAPQTYVNQPGDCNDNNTEIHPGAIEICGNKIDEDCSGADADYLYQPVLQSNGSNGFCEGGSVLLLISPFANGDSLFWNYNQSPIATTSGNFLEAANAGVYTATVIMANGCYYPLNSIIITEYPAPNPVISQNANGLSTGSFTNYSWYLNGTIIDGANDANWLPQSNGNYTVEVMDSNGCMATSATFTINNASILENEISTFSVYPNPAKEFVWIDLTSTENITAEILDLQGKTIYKTKINSNHFLMDLKELKSGIYFIKIGNKINKLILTP